MSNLKALLVDTFEILTETKDFDLGPGPLRDKKTLEEFIRMIAKGRIS